ncbi:MAG: PHP domain-containing protein [Lachnospiraceae bacterium]|nr:PHP domain-containing protein [Lachnospiraceae bacterium]
MIDLHTHSNKSDGSLTPTELIGRALEKKISAIALTDHDTVDGVPEALEAGKGQPIEVIPGIELSTEYHGREVHVVGLYIDYRNEAFLAQCNEFKESRTTRNHRMCDKLRTEAGMDITFEKLQAAYPESVITRAHYARYMLAKGYIKSLPEAFDRYIGEGRPYFIPRAKITPMEAVEIILSVGGIPILAHPILYHMSDEMLETLTREMKEVGLIGIEAIYSTYSAGEEREIRALAKKLDLAISGGSDFHGAAKPKLDLGTGFGKLYVPEEVLVHLKERAGR